MTALIIGVGHPHRGDDAVGLTVAGRLGCRAHGGLRVMALSGEAAELMDAWADSEAVAIVDAICGGGEVGAIVRIDAHTTRLPPDARHASSHGFGVAEAVALARQLGRLPARLVIYGIEGRRFGIGDEMSPEVERAAAVVADRLAAELCADEAG